MKNKEKLFTFSFDPSTMTSPTNQATTNPNLFGNDLLGLIPRSSTFTAFNSIDSADNFDADTQAWTIDDEVNANTYKIVNDLTFTNTTPELGTFYVKSAVPTRIWGLREAAIEPVQRLRNAVADVLTNRLSTAILSQLVWGTPLSYSTAEEVLAPIWGNPLTVRANAGNTLTTSIEEGILMMIAQYMKATGRAPKIMIVNGYTLAQFQSDTGDATGEVIAGMKTLFGLDVYYVPDYNDMTNAQTGNQCNVILGDMNGYELHTDGNINVETWRNLPANDLEILAEVTLNGAVTRGSTFAQGRITIGAENSAFIIGRDPVNGQTTIG